MYICFYIYTVEHTVKAICDKVSKSYFFQTTFDTSRNVFVTKKTGPNLFYYCFIVEPCVKNYRYVIALALRSTDDFSL